MSDLKTTFVIRTLAQYMQDVQETMKQVASRMNVGVTGEAVKSLAYKTMQQGDGVIGDLSFENVLRFVDMGVGRAHPLGGLKAMKVSLISQNKSGLILVKDKTRKAKKLYSKVAYGKLTWLQNNLLYGYTEETIAELKQQLEDENETVN